MIHLGLFLEQLDEFYFESVEFLAVHHYKAMQNIIDQQPISEENRQGIKNLHHSPVLFIYTKNYCRIKLTEPGRMQYRQIIE